MPEFSLNNTGDFKVYTVIISVDRNPNYLHETMESLDAQNIKYDISQGSLSTNNITGVDESKHKIVFAPESVDADYAAQGLRYKVQTNYINALTMAGNPAGGEDYRILFEDDIIISRNFLSYLNVYLKLVRRKSGGNNTVLSLYTPYKPINKEIGLRNGLASQFYGLQGMVYSNDTRIMFADYLRKHIGTKPHDFLLGDFCRQNNIQIYWASLSLVQHMGVVTTGLGHHHQTPNFLNDMLGTVGDTSKQPAL